MATLNSSLSPASSKPHGRDGQTKMPEPVGVMVNLDTRILVGALGCRGKGGHVGLSRGHGRAAWFRVGFLRGLPRTLTNGGVVA